MILIGALPVLAYIAMQIPAVQTAIAHEATKFASGKIDGKIYIDQISIALFNRLSIKNAYIAGENGDTLTSFRKLNIHISPRSLARGKINVHNITLRDGTFNYVVYEDGSNNLDNIFRIQKDSTESGKLPELYVNDLKLSEFRFKYIDHRKLRQDTLMKLEKDPGCIDFANIIVSDITVDVNKIKIDDQGVLKANLSRVVATDKSGWGPRALSGEVTWSRNEVRINDLYLRDNYSTVNSRFLSFYAHKKGDIRHYIDKIIMSADFTRTLFDFRTLRKITPALKANTLQVYLDGPVTGPVRDLYGENLRIQTADGKTNAQLTTRIHGLPAVSQTHFHADIKSINTTAESLEQALSDFTGHPQKILPGRIPDEETFFYSGQVDGYLSDFNSEGTLNCEKMGKIGYSVQVKDSIDRLKMTGHLSTQDVDVAEIIQNELIGGVSLDSDFSVTYDKDNQTANVELPDTKIHQLNLNGYDFTNIFLSASYTPDLLDTKLICHDPNLDFIFQGKNQKNSGLNEVNVYMDIPYANLQKLGLDKMNETSNIRFRAVASIAETKNLHSNAKKDYLGFISMRDIHYEGEDGEYFFEDINLHSLTNDNAYSVILNTPFLKMDYQGDFSAITFIDKISSVLRKEDISDLLLSLKDTTESTNALKSRLRVQTTDTQDICRIIAPKFSIADNTQIDLEMTEDMNLKLRALSDYISFGHNRINQLDLHFGNAGGPLRMDLKCKEILLQNAIMENSRLTAYLKDTTISMYYRFQNSSANKSHFDLSSDIWFEKDNHSRTITNIALKESELVLRDYNFAISPALIRKAPKFLQINGLNINSTGQLIAVDGTVTDRLRDKMSISIENFDLAFLNSLFNDKINVSGIVNGKANLARIFTEKPNIIMDIYGEHISLYDKSLGNLKILSKWSERDEQFNLLLNNANNLRNQINVIGYYKPETRIYNFDISLDQLDFSYAEPILEDLVKNTSGSFSGDINVMGTSGKLLVNTENLTFDNIGLTPLYTGVPYVLNGKVRASDMSVFLNDFTIQDDKGQTASLNAEVSHKFFKDIYVNAGLRFKNLHCLKTQESDNNKFYGDVFASGNVNMTGFLDNLLIDFACKTDEKTKVHIPIGSSSSATKTDLLSFTKNTSYYVPENEKIWNRTKPLTKKSKIQIKGKAEVNQNTQLLVEINKQMGDVIKCTGNGIIDLDMDPTTNKLDVRGDYTIDEGKYTFVLMGITSKDFLINKGANIAFNGDIANTSLNLGATYRTKASVSTLIGDKTAVESRRNIDCGIQMTGQLSNPQLSFTIDIPDLDPITKGKTESVLSSNDKIQKQFMALLISGSFIPDEQSSIVNNTTVLYSNAAEIISNQFNNVFRQLDIPLDLGLNYQPGENGKNDLFDVALSYQAFNNRVLINGNVGTSQKSAQAWTGNFETEVKIDKAGKFRIKLFTRSADDYSNYLDNSQRSGLGFTIQDEFDNAGDLFRSIFWSRKRKEAYELKKLKEAEEELIQESQARKEQARIKTIKE